MYGELPVCPMCDMVILQHVALHLSVLLAHVKILSPHMSLSCNRLLPASLDAPALLPCWHSKLDMVMHDGGTLQ